jgi:hypothetical protein
MHIHIFLVIFGTSCIFQISDYVRLVLRTQDCIQSEVRVTKLYKHSQIINQFQALRHNLFGRDPVYTYHFSDRYARYMTKEQ